MITRIEVDGFKSLRGFSLEFEPLTAIIGANGAGKSNLFDVLKLLSLLPRMNVTEAFRSLRGHIRDQFSQTNDGPGKSITITTDLLLDPNPMELPDALPTRLRHIIRIERMGEPSGLTEALEIAEERLAPIPLSEDSWIARHPVFLPFTRDADEYGFSVERRPMQSPYGHVNGIVDLSINRHELKYSDVATRQGSFLCYGLIGIRDVAHDISSIHHLHPDAGKLRLPSERGAGAMLLSDGSNLPTALASTTPETRAQIRADLADLVPGFRSFEIVPNDDELRLDIEFSDGTRTPARVLSDGTLRLLAVLTLLRTHQSRGVIAIEEPENGIYPGRLRALMKKLEEATSPTAGRIPPQIILNSHSPSLVAALNHRPESLVFADLVRRRDGLRSTRMRHVRTNDTETRDHTTVSRNEIEQYLDSARLEEEA